VIRFGGIVFAPRALPTLAALAFIALTVSLGRWQVVRGTEKETQQELYEARMREAPIVLTAGARDAQSLLYRRVRAAGEWVASGQVYVDNRVHEGRAGFDVVTPLRLDGRGESVLVVRGWVARGPEYPRAPRVEVPVGYVAVSGLAALPPRRFLELSPETVDGDVWQNLDLERYRARSGIGILPVVVFADPPAAGLAAVREAPDAGVAKHHEYALTWFSLAALAAVLWVALNVRRAP
jgi:surfeit locus 1 family protein